MADGSEKTGNNNCQMQRRCDFPRDCGTGAPRGVPSDHAGSIQAIPSSTVWQKKELNHLCLENDASFQYLKMDPFLWVSVLLRTILMDYG